VLIMLINGDNTEAWNNSSNTKATSARHWPAPTSRPPKSRSVRARDQRRRHAAEESARPVPACTSTCRTPASSTASSPRIARSLASVRIASALADRGPCSKSPACRRGSSAIAGRAADYFADANLPK
jgi:hypothetical protein